MLIGGFLFSLLYCTNTAATLECCVVPFSCFLMVLSWSKGSFFSPLSVSLWRHCSVTHMTPGQTSTPILRTTLNHSELQQPEQQQQQPDYHGAATNGSSAAGAATDPSSMQQVNLSSPPPIDAAALRKAEFY